MITRKELMDYHEWLGTLTTRQIVSMEKHSVDVYLETVASKNLVQPDVSGSVCECSEPIPQMTNKGMYCLRCETPIKQTDR